MIINVLSFWNFYFKIIFIFSKITISEYLEFSFLYLIKTLIKINESKKWLKKKYVEIKIKIKEDDLSLTFQKLSIATASA